MTHGVHAKYCTVYTVHEILCSISNIKLFEKLFRYVNLRKVIFNDCEKKKLRKNIRRAQPKTLIIIYFFLKNIAKN